MEDFSSIVGTKHLIFATYVFMFRHDWYQTESQVIVTVMVKNVPKDSVSVNFLEKEVWTLWNLVLLQKKKKSVFALCMRESLMGLLLGVSSGGPIRWVSYTRTHPHTHTPSPRAQLCLQWCLVNITSKVQIWEQFTLPSFSNLLIVYRWKA